MRAKFHEAAVRSVTKAVTFRMLILVSDGIIILAITHRLDVAVSVILFSNLASTVLYYIHERLWNDVHWGKMKNHIK